jgi:RNase H-fold protein (predicted Holliday junction resolvase)
LYVVNLDFLARTAISRTHAVSEEMYEMGEFILLTAQATAAAEGVAAETVVRKGNVREEIVSLSLEVGADYVVLGQPRAQKIGDTFDNELITQFSKRIAEETGAKVILAKEEDLG